MRSNQFGLLWSCHAMMYTLSFIGFICNKNVCHCILSSKQACSHFSVLSLHCKHSLSIVYNMHRWLFSQPPAVALCYWDDEVVISVNYRWQLLRQAICLQGLPWQGPSSPGNVSQNGWHITLCVTHSMELLLLFIIGHQRLMRFLYLPPVLLIE